MHILLVFNILYIHCILYYVDIKYFKNFHLFNIEYFKYSEADFIFSNAREYIIFRQQMTEVLLRRIYVTERNKSYQCMLPVENDYVDYGGWCPLNKFSMPNFLLILYGTQDFHNGKPKCFQRTNMLDG